MTLANRVSTFFLVALAAILLGNSLLLYAVAKISLHDRFEEQLESALRTLVAAVEVEEDDVKWEPSDHTVTLAGQTGNDEIRWMVFGDEGRILDQSRNLAPADRERLITHRQNPGSDLSPWRFLQRELSAPHPKSLQERSALEQSRITIVVARDASNLRGLLRSLGIALFVLPAICWLIAAALGRWYVAKAIAPVRKMAHDLRQIRGDDPQARLPIAATNDELQELGGSFNELLDAIFVAYERQRQFAGDAAHQLRTPLTILQGQVDVTLRRPRSDAEYRHTLSLVQDEVQQLSRTVETLLRLARPDEKSSPTELQDVELSGWLERCLSKWRNHARGPGIQHSCTAPLACRTRPELLEQLLEILLSNAVKYSPPDSPILIRGFREGSDCVLEIVDHGLGIAAEDRAAIFEPFFRTRAARQTGAPGVGLGLPLAKRIAASLEARLECDSQLGNGSTFRIKLPG